MNKPHKINFFKNKSAKGITFDIVFTGLMLSLVLVFQYLEKYMPGLGVVLKINLSLIFILITGVISGYPGAVFLLVFRFLITPALSTWSYTSIGIYSSFVLLFSDISFLFFFVFFFYLFKSIIKSSVILILLILITTTISTMIFLTTMNGLGITPLFGKMMKLGLPGYPQITDYYASHTTLQAFFLGIPSYWGGIGLVMGTGNLLKFSIVSLIIFPIIKITRYLS